MSGGPVVPLGRTPPEEPRPEPSRPPVLHGIATFLLAFSTAVALLASIFFVTVTWSGLPRRVVIATILFSIVVAVASFSISVLTAARHTYSRSSQKRVGDGDS